MEQAYERNTLQIRFGDAFSMLVASLHEDLGHNESSVIIARNVSADLEQAKLWVTGIKRAYYLVHLGSILKWLGDRQCGLALFEQALEIVQGQDRKVESEILEVIGEMYRGMGEPQHALELYEQALSIIDKMGDRTREARILVSIATAYQTMGQRQQALEIYEQALPIAREAGDRAQEGHILNNMAEVYRAISQLPQALELSEQALAISRELGYRAGEAVALSNMALIYFDMRQPEQALEIFEQALPIAREVSDRPQEATILNNIAGVYLAKKQMPKALEMFEQILPIMQETHNRPGEAVVLNNMGMIYQDLGQLNRSLDLLRQSLAIRREVSDRAGEGNMLNNIAIVYNDIGQPERSLEFFEQALPIVREVNDRRGEATALSSMALLLYQYFNRPKEAIAHLERSIAIMVEAGLTHNNADGRSIEEWRQFLEVMYRGVPLGEMNSLQTTLPAADVQQIITNTVVVMTLAPDQRSEWHQMMQENLKQIQQQGTKWQIEADFFTAILGVIDGQLPTLPDGHPYASALAAIYEGIAGGRPQIVDLPDALMQAVREFVYTKDWKIGRQVMEAQQALLFQSEVEMFFEQVITLAKFGKDQDTADLFEERLAVLRECKRIGIEGAFEKFKKRDEDNPPFDIESVAPIVAVLLEGSAEEKMQYLQHLATQAEQTGDEELKALIHTMQLALFGGDLMQLGQDLEGVYREVWEAVVTTVETDGFGPSFFKLIVHETTEVLSTDPDNLNGWRETLTQMRDQAREGAPPEFVLLVDAIIGLLDANGNPTGLGMQLTGIYEETWQEIMDRLA